MTLDISPCNTKEEDVQVTEEYLMTQNTDEKEWKN